LNIPDDLLPAPWYWLAWVIWLAVSARCAVGAAWRDLQSPVRLNLFLGTIVALIVIWSLRAGVRPGLDLHFIGAAVFTLCFGPRLAILGLGLVLVGVNLNGGGDWTAFALNAVLIALPSVLTSWGVLRLAEYALPPHVFVYVFVNGFFGAGLAVLAVGVCATALHAAAGIYPIDYLLEEYLPYYLLLGFSEAWLSGMIITLFVIYRPQWIASFDDARYLNDKLNKK